MHDRSTVNRAGADRRSLALALVIMLIACALRFFRLDAQELRGDEAASWARVTQTAGPIDLAQRLIREGQPHPPLHYWLLQIWERIFGESEFALRSLSALLSLIVVALIYRVTFRLTANCAVSLVAMSIGALHPYQIWLAQDVKNMYELVPIGLLIATLLLPRVLRGDRRAWIGYVIAGALSVLSHYYAAFGLLAHGAYIIWKRIDRRGWLRWMAAGIAVVLGVLPWIALIWPGLAVKQFSHPSQQSIDQFLLQTLGAAAWGPALPQAWAAPGILLVGFLSVLGGVQLWRSRRAWSVMLGAWLLITLIGIFSITRFRSTYNTFYLSNAYPALYILIALGLMALQQRRALLRLMSGALLIGCVLSWRNYYFEPAYSRTLGLRQVARALTADSRSGDVLITNQPDPAAIYYLRNLAIPIVLLPPDPAARQDQIDQALDQLAAQHDRLWHLPARSSWDPNGSIEAQLRDRYLLAVDARFKLMRLQEYVPRPETAPEYHALKVEFEQGIQLLGSFVTVNGDPLDRQPQAGEWLRVTLFWTTSAPLTADYTVFVHAIDSSGRIVAQEDSRPRHNALPTSSWQAQQIVLDAHEFQLPEASAFDSLVIRIGLYDPVSGQRLKVMPTGDSVEVWSSSAR